MESSSSKTSCRTSTGQLACWDRPNVESHTVSGEQTSLAKPQNVTMTLDEAPARIRVTVNLAKYPQAFQLVAKARGAQSPPVQLDINPGQTKYDFEDVQLGNYNIILLAKPVLTKGPDGELDVSIPSLAEKRVQVKKGETAEVQF